MPKEHGASYRRGVLLGLTMAEIFILIIFLLLLAFANLLSKKDHKFSEMQQRVQLIEKNHDAIKRIVTAISEKPDMTKELIEISEALPSFIEKIKENNLLKEGQSIDQYLAQLIEKAKAEKILGENEIDKTLPIAEQLELALNKQKELEDELKNLQGRNENLTTQMKGEGKSVDPPPCWPDNFKKGGWKDSIFKIDLTSRGIIINDNAPAERSQEKSRLPLDKIKYGSVRSMSEFYGETRPLFTWSKEHDCRFLVLVYDRTGAQEKARYKELLKVVEGHFYKKEIGVTQSTMAPAVAENEASESKPPAIQSEVDKYGRYKPKLLKGIFNN